MSNFEPILNFRGYQICLVIPFLVALLLFAGCINNAADGQGQSEDDLDQYGADLVDNRNTQVPTNQTMYIMSLLETHKSPIIVRHKITAADVVNSIVADTNSLPVSYVIINSAATQVVADFEATNMTIAATLDEICKTWGLKWEISGFTIIIKESD